MKNRSRNHVSKFAVRSGALLIAASAAFGISVANAEGEMGSMAKDPAAKSGGMKQDDKMKKHHQQMMKDKKKNMKGDAAQRKKGETVPADPMPADGADHM